MSPGGEESKGHQLRIGHQEPWLQSPTQASDFRQVTSPPGDSIVCRVKRVRNTHPAKQEAGGAHLKQSLPFCCVSFSAEIPSKEMETPPLGPDPPEHLAQNHTCHLPKTHLSRPRLRWMPKFSAPPSCSPHVPAHPHPTAPRGPSRVPCPCAAHSYPNPSEGGADLCLVCTLLTVLVPVPSL